jgi:hypothetical protein
MVDLVGRLWIEVANRVVADGGEVNHRVEANQIFALDVTDIRPQGGDLGGLSAEGAGGEEIGVESDDFVAGPLEYGNEH